MTRRQLSIITDYHTDGAPYTSLVDYPDTRAEMTADTMGGADEEAWLAEHADAIADIDSRRADLMRTPEGRAALRDLTLVDWSDWDDLLRAWSALLDEAEAELASAE